jgi:hypothetical protein
MIRVFAYIEHDRSRQTDNKMENQRNGHVLYATWSVVSEPHLSQDWHEE